jgi:hypothetical protein
VCITNRPSFYGLLATDDIGQNSLKEAIIIQVTAKANGTYDVVSPFDHVHKFISLLLTRSTFFL